MYGQYGHFVHASEISTETVVCEAFPVMGCNRIAVEIETFATGLITATANIYVQVCDTSDGTFRRLQIGGVYSSGSGILDWEVPSNTGARYYQLPEEVTGYNYAKIEVGNTCTASFDFRIHKMM